MIFVLFLKKKEEYFAGLGSTPDFPLPLQLPLPDFPLQLPLPLRV